MIAGLVIDSFFAEQHRLHDPSGSNENAARAARLVAALQAEPNARLINAADFGLAPIRAVHTRELISFLQTAYSRFVELRGRDLPAVPDSFAVRAMSGRIPRSVWGQLGYYCADGLTPILARTWEAAYWSAQVALSAAQSIADGASLAYALCRPPGHHAYADLIGGYCYLNNTAIAVQRLVSQGNRVAIIDTDYHHGNGTQSIFYDRDDVFFSSLHADPAEEYPYFCGYADEQGDGRGRGFSLNVLLPLGTIEDVFLIALDTALMAVVEFEPDVVVVSHGFDTLAGDPEGGFGLTVASFEAIGRRLGDLNRPLLVVQEGGYLLESLQPSMSAFLHGLLGY